MGNEFLAHIALQRKNNTTRFEFKRTYERPDFAQARTDWAYDADASALLDVEADGRVEDEGQAVADVVREAHVLQVDDRDFLGVSRVTGLFGQRRDIELRLRTTV